MAIATRDIHRKRLERKALETCSSELYYDVENNIEATSNYDLRRLIACKGRYENEAKVFGFSVDE